MAQSIIMPALSAGMEEATVARWLKGVGDIVAAGDVIAGIETDTLSVDHRAVDGAVGARKFAAFRSLVEQPLQLLL